MPYLVFGAKDGEIAGIVEVSPEFVAEHLPEARLEATSWGFEIEVNDTVVSPTEVDTKISVDGPMVQLRTYLRTLRDPSE